MTTTKKPTQQRKRKPKKRAGRKNNPFRRIPSYVLWTLLSIVVVIYIIFFYKTFVSPYSFRWKALYGNVTYPDGKVRGIDVSHYQEDINWEKLRNADLQGSPVHFIFVKATEGSDIIDENFNQNFYNARKNEIIRGAYHFFSTKTPAEKQARFFCKIVQLEDDDLPPVLDVESIGELSPRQLQSEVHTWMKIVGKHYGVTPILYTSYKFKNSYLNTKEFDKYPYWIAHYYVDSLTYKGDWAFWQHTDAGHVDGVRGYVDVNIFNGDYKRLIELTLGAGKEKKTNQ